MSNFSEFDKEVKFSILDRNWDATHKLINDFYGQIHGNDQTLVFNALMKYYFRNQSFKSFFEKDFNLVQEDIQTPSAHSMLYNYRIYPNSKILIIRPESALKSAGSHVLQSLAEAIRSNGFAVDELVYFYETNLDILFSKSSKFYSVVIIPETLSCIPKLNTINIAIYHGNKFGKLPQIRLGTQFINPTKTINYVHSHSIDQNMMRLFFNTLNFERFKPSQTHRKGGRAIYLGKFQGKSESGSKLAYISKKFNTNLIITRDFPDSACIPSFAKELDLLITLDPISSTNLEFAAAGCPVLFVNYLDYFDQESIKKYELLNDNFRFSDEDIGLFDFAQQISIHKNLSQVANIMQMEDLKNFMNQLNSLVGTISLPS